MSDWVQTEGTLAHLQLLKKRPVFLRLDWTPFALVYGIGIGEMVAMRLAEYGKRGMEEEGVGVKGGEGVGWIGVQLGVVVVLHVLLGLFCYWSVAVRSLVGFVQAKNIHEAHAVIVRQKGYTAKKVLVPLTHRKLRHPLGEDHYEELGFEVAQQRYVYNYKKHSFEKLAYPTQEPLSWYLRHEGFRDETDLAAALANWGPNVFEVDIPQFTALLKQQLLAPFFVFQVFCVSLWCLDEYWMYSVFTLCMLVFFECTVSGQRLRNLHHLRSLQSPKQQTSVYRSGTWERIPGELLLPGDIISIGRPAHGHDELVVPADVVLISGSCIVDESVLTGESTPQWKSPLSAALEEGLTTQMPLDLKRDKPHVLFGGTKCLQHTPSKDSHIKCPDGGCLAVVVRTGFETAQGHLMGTILHSTEHVTANNWETGVFILFLLCFAIAASGYVLYHGLRDPSRSRFQLFLSCTMIVTSVIPPELPMELSIAVNQSLIRLMKKKIFCTEPFRIPFAGKVDVCCFDKTGTLTDDSMILDGVTGMEPGNNSEIIAPRELRIETSRVLAGCQSLIIIDGERVGDPLEKAAFEATGWSYRSDLAVHPRRAEELLILHRYHFSAQLKRMSTVVRCRPSSGPTVNYVVSKGAPEIMQSRFRNAPTEYQRLYKKFAATGGRIIALGYRVLDESIPRDESAMRGMDRESAETDLDFAGFAVFQCPLKPDSAPALRMLKQSSHQLVMITGDAPLTACNAAGRVHIVTRPVLVLHNLRAEASDSAALSEADFVWMNPEETERIAFSSDQTAMLRLAERWDLCITGEAFPFLERNKLSSFILPLIQVFARVAPEHKEKVVDTLRAEGRVVLMCGDGTNDVGGLKAAHVGVALLTGVIERAKKLAARRRGENSRRQKRTEKSKTAATGSDNNPALRMIEEMERQGAPVNPRLRKIAELVEEMNQDPGLLKPGDASMAAPFTAKQASVMPCTDLIMQGRSTLVSTVQMFKILGLMSLANAYAFSVMHLQGVKIGDIQVTVTGLLTAGMFFFLSNTQPLSVLSKQRPHAHIFCPYVFLSVLGQSLLHMSYLIYLYQCAVHLSPPTDSTVEDEASDTKFKPNLVNSVCFLVNFIIQIITFAVNYSGAPFTTPLLQNQGLSKCLLVSAGVASLLALDIIPGFCSFLEMVFIPFSLRAKILLLGFSDLFITYSLEHFLRYAFPAPLPPEKGFMSHPPQNRKSKKD